jgi:hypothetical protein
MFPLFDKPGLIHHQHPSWVSQFRHHVPAQIFPHRSVVPGVSIQNPLHPPGMTVASMLR